MTVPVLRASAETKLHSFPPLELPAIIRPIPAAVRSLPRR